jgi:hypothetical protein
MPAPKRVPDDQVREAITAWRGNVQAAADALGIQPKNLRERTRALGIDLDDLRKGAGRMGRIGQPAPLDHTGPFRYEPAPMTPNGRPQATGVQIASGLYQEPTEGSNLSAVQMAAEDEVIPIKTTPRRQHPIRLKPAQRERLQRAVFELQARYGVGTDENLILEQFIDEGLEAWLESKLKAPKSGRRKGEGGGEE